MHTNLPIETNQHPLKSMTFVLLFGYGRCIRAMPSKRIKAQGSCDGWGLIFCACFGILCAPLRMNVDWSDMKKLLDQGVADVLWTSGSNLHTRLMVEFSPTFLRSSISATKSDSWALLLLSESRELKVSPMNVLLLPEGSSFCACLWWPILVWLDIGNSMGSIDSMHNKRHLFFFAMASFLQSCRRRMELGFHSIRTHAFDLVLSQNLTLNQHIFLGLILYTEARIIMDQKLGTRICGRSTKLSLWAMRKVHHHLGR